MVSLHSYPNNEHSVLPPFEVVFFFALFVIYLAKLNLYISVTCVTMNLLFVKLWRTVTAVE